jgi:hypothetical protein
LLMMPLIIPLGIWCLVLVVLRREVNRLIVSLAVSHISW